MLLDRWPQLAEQGLIDVVDEDHEMGVADGYRCSGHRPAAGLQRPFLSDVGLSHADRHAPDPAAPDLHLQAPDAGHRLHGQARLIRIALVVDVLSDAADPVAAHGRLTAVGIEYPHPEIRRRRMADVDHSVRTGAEMAVGQLPRQLGYVVGDLPEYVQIIVSQTVHLGKMHHCISFHSASMVETPNVTSSRTSRSIRTVSSDVSIVMLFAAAARRIATPSP